MTKKRKKYKSVITKRIFKSIQKIGTCFLVLAFISSLSIMQGTNAGYLDKESSENNVFGSSTLDFSVSSNSDFSPKVSPSMETLREVSISKEGLEDFQYRIFADNFSGDTDLCDELNIKDDLDDSYQSLSSYVSSNTDNLTKTDWNFTIQLVDNDDALADKTCDFDLKFEAWQTGNTYGAGGFVDIEVLSSQIESEHWTNIADHLVINEVYYDVDGSHGAEGDNEWVEIYNPTSSAVNIKDWQICDNGGCDVITSLDLDIPANGYAVITDEASTWGFWTVPGSAIKIALGSSIGSGLNNSGDRLILEDDNGLEIDAMSYGTDVVSLNPACPDVSEGHSLARKPAGQDLDVNSDFEDLSSPNPGTNPHTIVMNEILPNPVGDDDAEMPSGEWVELYNYGEYLIDLAGWKLEDGDGNNLDITEANTDTGSTLVAGGERIVIYRDGDGDFDLNNNGDEVRLVDEKDLIKDFHEFEETPEGKTIARFPDAVGPWIDPEGTPGEENEMTSDEKKEQILVAYEECFKNDKLDKKEKYEPVCQVEYLHYLRLLEKLDDEKVNYGLIEKMKSEVKEGDEEELALEEMKGNLVNDAVVKKEGSLNEQDDLDETGGDVNTGEEVLAPVEEDVETGGEADGEEVVETKEIELDEVDDSKNDENEEDSKAKEEEINESEESGDEEDKLREDEDKDETKEEEDEEKIEEEDESDENEDQEAIKKEDEEEVEK